MSKSDIKQASIKSAQTLKSAFPILIGVLLIINLLSQSTNKFYSEIFTGNNLVDPFVGALAGSISFGIPITSYIAGGELLSDGVSLVAVTAFMIAWTTVGIAMLPLEASMLGKKFALVRNSVNFVYAVIIAVLVVKTVSILQ